MRMMKEERDRIVRGVQNDKMAIAKQELQLTEKIAKALEES